jgi:hypothetical protein
VAFGDSITDGYLSLTGANARWPNYLARSLDAATGDRAPGVVDEGISGNRVLSDSTRFGVSALSRFERDALSQPGVKTVIFLEGINEAPRCTSARGMRLSSPCMMTGRSPSAASCPSRPTRPGSSPRSGWPASRRRTTRSLPGGERCMSLPMPCSLTLTASARRMSDADLRGVTAHSGVFEMTWDGDGRATFSYGAERVPGQAHIIWRRTGTHAIFTPPPGPEPRPPLPAETLRPSGQRP